MFKRGTQFLLHQWFLLYYRVEISDESYSLFICSSVLYWLPFWIYDYYVPRYWQWTVEWVMIIVMILFFDFRIVYFPCWIGRFFILRTFNWTLIAHLLKRMLDNETVEKKQYLNKPVKFTDISDMRAKFNENYAWFRFYLEFQYMIILFEVTF